MDLVSSVNAYTVFVAIAAIGFLFLLISLVFGEIFEHFDHDVDHGGPGFFSTRVMAVFVTTFGVTGAVATNYRLAPLPASLMAFASGVVFASAILAFARFLYAQQATSEVRTSDLVGQSARVVVSIPPGGVGQIRCRIGEELVDKIARAQDGQPIAENTPVRVEEVLGETVVVRKH